MILDMLVALDQAVEDVQLPFLIVVERRLDAVRVRLRKPQ